MFAASGPTAAVLGRPGRPLPMAATPLVAVAALVTRALFATRPLVALVTPVTGRKNRALRPANRRIERIRRPIGGRPARLVMALHRHPDLPLLDAVAVRVTSAVMLDAGAIHRAIQRTVSMTVHRTIYRAVRGAMDRPINRAVAIAAIMAGAATQQPEQNNRYNQSRKYTPHDPPLAPPVR